MSSRCSQDSARYLCILTPSFGHYWRLNGRICPLRRRFCLQTQMNRAHASFRFAFMIFKQWQFIRVLWTDDGASTLIKLILQTQVGILKLGAYVTSVSWEDLSVTSINHIANYFFMWKLKYIPLTNNQGRTKNKLLEHFLRREKKGCFDFYTLTTENIYETGNSWMVQILVAFSRS